MTGQTRPRWPTVLVVVGAVVLVGLMIYGLGDRQPGAAPEPSGTAGPTSAATPTPTPSPTATATPTAGPTPTADPTVAPRVQAPVAVLNQSGLVGLAGRTAAVLTEAGWEVPVVDDAALGVPATTLYVPAGLEDAGATFGGDFPAVTRSRAAFEGLAEDALTLVLAQPDAASVVAALERGAGAP